MKKMAYSSRVFCVKIMYERGRSEEGEQCQVSESPRGKESKRGSTRRSQFCESCPITSSFPSRWQSPSRKGLSALVSIPSKQPCQ